MVFNKAWFMQNLVLHLLFSLAVLIGLYTGVHFYWGLLSDSVLITALSCLFFLFCIYLGRWLCNFFYLRHRPFAFISYTALVLAGIIILWPLFAKYILHTAGDVIEYAVGIVPFYIIALIMGIFIKATRSSIQKQVLDAKAAAEQKQVELKLLQSQLSPHFLFNTLNNMYGISIAQHERIPALLLKLSDLLRYSVYDTKQPLVPLTEEISYINNYIHFEKIRIGEKLNLNLKIESIEDASIMIAPMLLVVFIENAFKHSKNTLDQKVYIDISLKLDKEDILFDVNNSFDGYSHQKDRLETNSGIGLTNVNKRLELLYPGQYHLRQYQDGKIFYSRLSLKIKYRYG